MKKDDYALMISSCDKFSDLWQEYFKLLRTNWPDIDCPIYLVTDKTTKAHFEGVNILSIGDNIDFTMRIKKALDIIEEPYVLLTLDDYFLIEQIKNSDIRYLAQRAAYEHIDYLLLYDRRKTNPRKYCSVDYFQKIDLKKKYAVTLYPAIWNASFLRKTVKEDITPWTYEASLSKIAIEERANCQFSQAGSFRILDVVRKGKILHKANRYFKTHNIDVGDRPIISIFTEIKLAVEDVISWYMPRRLFKMIKKIAKKMGMKFYSED